MQRVNNPIGARTDQSKSNNSARDVEACHDACRLFLGADKLSNVVSV